MIYLENSDLTADAYQRFITESQGDGEDVLNKCELRAIAMVKTYISSRYDVLDIFGDEELETEPLRNELLVEIISKITLYRLFGRNAARKLPADIKEDFEWALKMLEKIQTGRLQLDLPPALDEGGLPKSNSIWGNNSNQDFYI